MNRIRRTTKAALLAATLTCTATAQDSILGQPDWRPLDDEVSIRYQGQRPLAFAPISGALSSCYVRWADGSVTMESNASLDANLTSESAEFTRKIEALNGDIARLDELLMVRIAPESDDEHTANLEAEGHLLLAAHLGLPGFTAGELPGFGGGLPGFSGGLIAGLSSFQSSGPAGASEDLKAAQRELSQIFQASEPKAPTVAGPAERNVTIRLYSPGPAERIKSSPRLVLRSASRVDANGNLLPEERERLRLAQERNALERKQREMQMNQAGGPQPLTLALTGASG